MAIEAARMAEAVASCWGNLIAGARVVGEDETGKWIVAEAFAWDLQANVRYAFGIYIDGHEFGHGIILLSKSRN